MPDVALEPEKGWTTVQPFPFAAARRTFTADEQDPDRLKIRYFKREKDGALVAKVWFGPRAEGAPGAVHGGGLLTALDEAMGAAVWMLGAAVMTVRLDATFRRQVPVGALLLVETEVADAKKRVVAVKGRLIDKDGLVYLEGTGSFARLNPSKVDAIFGRSSGKPE